MGKRSDRSKFRRRRRWAAFVLLSSLALVVFGVMLIRGMSSPGVLPAASGGVERIASVRVAEAPETARGQEDEKTAGEKNEVDGEAAQRADKKQTAGDQAQQQGS